MAAAGIYTWSAYCSVLALIACSHDIPQSRGATWRRDSAAGKLVTSRIFGVNETAESNSAYRNRSRDSTTFTGANDFRSAKRATSRANRVTIAHSKQPSSSFGRHSKQTGLSHVTLHDVTTKDTLLRRPRQSGNETHSSVGGAWSRDEASKTLDLLESSLKSAAERCSVTSTSLSSLQYQLPVAVLDRFSVEVASAVHAANLLSLIHRPNVQVDRSGGDVTLFYSWLVRSLLDSSNDYVHSVTVITLRQGTISAPQAWRSTAVGQSRVHTRDVTNTVAVADWFAVLQEQNSTFRPCEMGVANRSAGGVVSESRDVIWTSPFVNCTLSSSLGNADPGSWLVSLVMPVYSCTENYYVITEGAVKIDIDLNRVSIDQCSSSNDVFANTHRCLNTTTCVPSSRRGLRRGNYQCHCNSAHFFPSSSMTSKVKYFDGKDLESKHGRVTQHDVTEFSCLPCAAGCARCDDANACDDDVGTSRVVLLTIQVFLMAASVLSGVAIVRLRKSKVMKASFWLLLEIIVVGVVLIQATVLVDYFNPSHVLCLSIPWLREVGFIVVYGALQLKVFRVLAEFQSRKAQRVLLRDKDLLKYLLLLIIIGIGYLVTWTVVTLDYSTSGDDELIVETRHEAGSSVLRSYCKQGWWHYAIEAGECIFLSIGLYLCYCIRSAPTFYLETKFISFAIFNELIVSAVYYIVRHCMWSLLQPNHLLIMSFLRCHFTATVTLLLVIVTKIWFTHRPPNDRSCRRRTYSTSETVVPSGECGGEQIKMSTDSGVDVGEINLADMNPEDIRLELRRLYTQLQVYKTKSMRRDNPHISKRRGGRKPTHRRFSLQAFHYKHRLQQTGEQSTGEGHDLEPASRTPEESTNSADIGQTASQCYTDELVTSSPRTSHGGAVRKQ